MEEVIVAAADSEPTAEIIASRLRVEGIAVRVRYDSQAGIPRQIAPAGLGFGPGAFRIAVPVTDAERAREILADAEPEVRRRSAAFRVVAAVVLISFVLAWIPGVLEAIRIVLGLGR
ncbi:MAG: putative prokaryotic signal transducing protein [Chloroflexota bacterium]|nr:putative prokaryotic signal transducing protein [Chloroflexota bacterium]